MFKIFGSAFIIACCTYLGVNKIKEMNKRIDGLYEFRAMLIQLRVEIEMKNTPLPYAIKNIGERFNNKCFKSCGEMILKIGGQAAFEKSLRESANQYSFSENEISAIGVLGQGLGRCDLINQLRQIDYCISRIDIALEEAKSELSKKNSIYVSGSVMFGALIVLILL